MLSAIELNDQHRFEAREIDDIRMEAVLEAELETAKLAVSDRAQEAILGIGAISAEPGGVTADLAAHRMHRE